MPDKLTAFELRLSAHEQKAIEIEERLDKISDETTGLRERLTGFEALASGIRDDVSSLRRDVTLVWMRIFTVIAVLALAFGVIAVIGIGGKLSAGGAGFELHAGDAKKTDG